MLHKVLSFMGIVGLVAAGLTFSSIDVHSEAPALVAPPVFGSLKDVQVPEPTHLDEYVANRNAAIVLGKALFWDMQAGSDGQACASCHFHAGADRRVKNQLSPGLLAGDMTFQPTASGGSGGPNYTLKKNDFPTYRLLNPLDRNSAIVFDANDVTSSQGSFGGTFVSTFGLMPEIAAGSPLPQRRVVTKRKAFPGHQCTPEAPGAFQVRGKLTRKVEPRNTPTVINAIFFFRTFWDGRANNHFNGVDPFGRRSPNAHILAVQPDGAVLPVSIDLENASLASQAVGPPLSDFEMACAGLTFPDLGKKLLSRQPLAFQRIADDDSVLGPYRNVIPAGGARGLVPTYADLVRQAFPAKYWNSAQTFDGDKYTLMEKNFSFFWGMAIQLYEAMLVSDDAPIDRYLGNAHTPPDPRALTEQEKRGFALFQGKGHCSACHVGPEFSGAASRLQMENQENGLVERMVMGDGAVGLYDNGFYNIGVRPTAEDLGVGGEDMFGNPLSFTRQYRKMLQGQNAPDPLRVDPCTFDVNPCVTPSGADFRDVVDGAFKTPTLRNIELTGPYFHNGSRATLAQVVEFYNRGGDRRGQDGDDTTGLGVNKSNLDADIQLLELTDQEKADLVAFLKRPLTDERVRCEQAPFDHPSLRIVAGHSGNAREVDDANHDGKADDNALYIPAVGATGVRPSLCLRSFAEGLS